MATLNAGNERSRNSRANFGIPNYVRVASDIRQDIVYDRLSDGQRLTTIELAQHYGLSLAPVREALLALAAEGLVVIHPKRGAVVCAVTPAFLRDIYEVRLGLIPYIEGERAALATDDDIARMVAAEQEYEHAVSTGVNEDIIQSNIKFHQTMATVRVNIQAEQILARHHLLTQELRRRYGFVGPHRSRAIEEHNRLIAAYKRGSKSDARETSRIHLQSAFDELLDIMQHARSSLGMPQPAEV
ncbi:GntR family transcriptional regulator [Microvirga aerilata]|uniref:GntR family transcriptional regulator n=1 Tax=Microvirga aerilata TaxID=670292 RepID=A0A937D064_9HYPH|nr:GntR family transcriptional regulator [Microvirga aerilata]MBL0405511.1 GntR family transcriptional regulator [Microvirga aerilata]